MKIFDEPIPVDKEFCELCKKEIEPGEKMIMSTICPSHARQRFNRNKIGIYNFIDNAHKYHELCYLKKMKKKFEDL